MQAGKVIEVRVRAARVDGSAHRGPAMAAFFVPGKDPEHVPADRVPDREVPLTFDEPSRICAGQVSTAGWAVGRWTVRGTVLSADGSPAGWAWYTFPVEPLPALSVTG